MKKLIIAFVALVGLGTLVYFGFMSKQKEQLHQQATQNKPDPKDQPFVTVNIKLGGEKMGFIRDPAVIKILLEDWHIQVSSVKDGSVEMVQSETSGFDAIWPASEYNKQIFVERASRMGFTGYKTTDIFSSPLVNISWPQITDALAKRGVVKRQENAYYVMDMAAQLRLIEDRLKWKDIDPSVAMIYGSVNIKFTQPTKSNSGASVMGLYANIMNGDEPPTAEQIVPLLKRLKAICDRGGMKEESSGDIFNHALSQGMGAYPIFAVYENQYLEALAADQGRSDLRTQLIVMYPQPTVFAAHPFIALNKNGQRLMEALQDPKIQKIAWEQHGFRSATPGIMNDPLIFQTSGIPKQVLSVIPMPEWAVMQKITDALTNP